MARWWSRERLVNLGYLAGIGCSGPQIAAALGITNVQAISNACQRYGVKLHHRRDGRLVQDIPVSRKALDVLDEAAAARGIKREVLLQRLLEIYGEGEAEDGLDLVTSVLDDGCRR